MKVNAEELIDYRFNNIIDLQKALETENYDIAYGDTYSIREVRNFIKAKQPVFVEMGDSTLFFVGENKESLVAYKDGESYAISDKELKKAWTGEIVAVLGKAENYGKTTKQNEVDDFAIFDSIRDNWDREKEDIKIKAKNQIAEIKNLPAEILPTHPVIVTFVNPPEKSKKAIRASSCGADITIYDSSDPVTEFLHELGHVYWRTQLSKSEKKNFAKLLKKLDKKNPPGVFLAKWELEEPEEFFSTIYYWYLRGKLTNPGYLRIFRDQYLTGYNTLVACFERVRKDIENQVIIKAQIEKIESFWKENEISLLRWVNKLTNTPTLTLVQGKGLRKAHLPAVEPVSLFVPNSLKYTLIAESGNRQWILVKAGRLKDKFLILKNGKLDVDFMRGKKDKYFWFPIQKIYKSSGKEHCRVDYVKPERFYKALERKNIVIKLIKSKKNKKQFIWKKTGTTKKDKLLKNRRKVESRFIFLPNYSSRQFFKTRREGLKRKNIKIIK
jgi:hypothetical protein